MTDISMQSDPVIRKYIKKKKIAIIPVGAIEQHGPHLPISTDSDIVSEVAKRLAKRMNYLLLPTIRYGVSAEHAPLFQVSLKETTLRRVLKDICTSLHECGITIIFIVNGHHGNTSALKGLDEKINKDTKGMLNVHILSYWHFMEGEFDHAGHVETSLMLAISKNVKMELARKGLVTDNMSENEIRRLGRLATKSFPSVTKNGVWGDPTRATKKKGQAIMSEIVENMQKRCQTCLTENNP